ncbi:MAG: (2Fe-2S)-binding protein [Phycisphaerae bacterium]
MALQPDDIVCFCFHVRLRKIEAFCRIEKPRHASQISDCLSAGTGCGWCRPMLKHIHLRICGTYTPEWQKLPEATPGEPDAARKENVDSLDILDVHNWAAGRQRHIADGRGKPPPGQ